MRVRLFLWTLLALVALASIASAQTPPEVTAGQAFTVKADHDGANTDGYKVFIDGAATPVATVAKATALVDGVVTITVQAGVARGPHTVALEAYNADRATRTAPLAFTAKLPAPSVPSGLRFVVVTLSADGTPATQLLDLAAVRQVLALPPLE